MLTPDQITALRDRARQVADPINEYLLADIARRISEAGQLTSTASYEVWRAQQLGMSQYEIKKQLKKLLKVSNSEIDRLLTQSAQVGYRFDLDRLPTARAIPFEENAAVQQIVFAAVKLAQDDFTNITQTLGMTDPLGRALPLQEAYRSCMDFAFKQVATGAVDYNTAIRQATKNLAARGVLTIDYQSGVSTSLEAAVRRNIMGGLGLMQEQLQQETHDDLGCDGWEITAHANSAPDHEPLQGKQYSDADYTALNNSLVRRIGTLNCGHAAFPIILGVSIPQYTAEELQKFREDNEKGVTYGGRHYTGYEATQLQRRLESTMRKHKRRILVDKASGDAEKLQQDQIRLQVTRQEYTRFSKAAGLRTENERARVEGFGYEEAKRARDDTEKEFRKVLATVENGDKIVLSEGMEDYIAGQPFEKITALSRKLSDRATRKWYLAQDSTIAAQLDPKQSLEEMARRAFEIRNLNRTYARDLMRDQKKRLELDRTDPNRTFEELIADKMRRKGLTREEALQDVISTAGKTRQTVNKLLGLG